MEKLFKKKNIVISNMKYLLILFVFSISFNSLAQETSYIKGNEYILKDVSVSGLKNFNEQTVITYTGLKEGQKIRIPGEQISAIISKLWKLDLFSDINFYLINVQDDPEDFLVSNLILSDKDELALLIARTLLTISFQKSRTKLFQEIKNFTQPRVP